MILWVGFSVAAVTALTFIILYLKEREKYIRSSTEFNSLAQSHKELESLSQQLEKVISNNFKVVASEVLEGNSKQFFQLAKMSFDQQSQENKNLLEKKELKISALVDPLKKSLEEYAHQISYIEKQRLVDNKSIEMELKKVFESNQILSSETNALKNALKKPHIRGRWGEVQLKNCIELAGMSEYCDVSFQDQHTGDDGQRLIPDMTVKMPGGHTVVVDAKTPLDAFLSSLEATTEEERLIELSRHGRHVKDHVKNLSSKAYAESIPGSADFTVLFLPNESFLYAALEVEPEIVEFALEKKILIATPPTLIGLLKVIRFGWNEEKLAENAQKISMAGQELHKRICDFLDAYANMGKHLEKAQEEYNKGYKRLESRVLVQAKKLETLGAKSNKSLPEASV
ncbi:MAG: DNA recombination protein RmuC [Bdellovibrionales bacterium]|nr:DNA recombination protein RmuC [Bdellovibrionales bacterium]